MRGTALASGSCSDHGCPWSPLAPHPAGMPRPACRPSALPGALPQLWLLYLCPASLDHCPARRVPTDSRRLPGPPPQRPDCRLPRLLPDVPADGHGRLLRGLGASTAPPRPPGLAATSSRALGTHHAGPGPALPRCTPPHVLTPGTTWACPSCQGHLDLQGGVGGASLGLCVEVHYFL